MEVPSSTPEDPDKENKLDKGWVRLWMRSVLLFIAIMVVKGLLITSAYFILRVNAKGSVHTKPNPLHLSNMSSDRKILQLHAEIQRLTTLLHNITTDSRCQICPKRWHWFEGHCYFLSAKLEEDRRWAESAEYCAEHNASLAVIQHESEMDFILSHSSRFSETPFLWLGLTDTRLEGVWVWQDGTLLQNHRFIKVQWNAEHRNCADLRGDGSVFASDCQSYGPWLCEKPMEPPEI